MVVDVRSGMASKLQAIVNLLPKDLETSMKVAAQCCGFSEIKKQQENEVKATLCGKDVCVFAYWIWKVVNLSNTASVC